MKQLSIAAILVGLFVTGCGSKTTISTPDGTVTTTQDGKSVTVKGADGKEVTMSNDGGATTMKDDKGNSATMGASVSEGELGLPFYPDSTEQTGGSMVAEEAGVKSVLSARKTKDDPEKVTEFYKSKVEGGTVSNTSSDKMKMSILGGGKLKNGAEVNISAMRQGDEETTITVGVKNPKK